jgi:flagellar L-ring protein precursor FlgH
MKTLITLIVLALCSHRSLGQSLHERPAGVSNGVPERNGTSAPATTAAAPAGANGSAGQLAAPPATSAALSGVSLFLVTPPPQRTYNKNDIVEIIINETSTQKSEQSLDTKKEYSIAAELTRFPSLRHLLEAQLRDGDTTPIAGVEADSNNEFNGDGEYERKDKFNARIAAVVIEVKPNGTLLLEARKQVTSNKEETTLVLSGLARPEDITTNNTVQSSQLANLALTVKNEGDLKSSASKGLIPQLLDTIFNF